MQWSVLYLLSEWIIRILMLVYVPQRRTAAASRTWLLLIFLLPWPGLILYMVFGRIYVSRARLALYDQASSHLRQVQRHLSNLVGADSEITKDLQPIVSLATQLGEFHPFAGNQVEFLTDYEGTVENLIRDIAAARHQVHLLFYIYAPDSVGYRVTDALQQASRRGVQCRVLLDAVGSKAGLRAFGTRMRAAGIDVRAALPVGLFRRNAARFDLRNHRKLAVIDGRIAYTGSQNLVEGTFVPGYPNEELMVRVQGPVVAQLQAVFLADFAMETRKPLGEAEHFPEVVLAGKSIAQAIPSGPGYHRENARDLILELLYAARERVGIVTPYFVPDEPVLVAMQAATRRGVKVQLIVPEHTNQWVTHLAQQSYYEDLLESGVELYLYRPRFLHAKHVSVDRHIAFVGSTNIDIRSFALNAELNLLIYDTQVATQLREIQEQCLLRSRRLETAEWRQRRLIPKVLQNTARLADSLL